MNKLLTVLRVVFGIAFFAAGCLKLSELSSFVETVGDFGIVDDRLVYGTAITVCVLELVIGVGLLAGHWLAIPLAIVLVVVFASVLSYGLWLGLDIDCGCLGPASRIPMAVQLGIDIILLLVLSIMWFGSSPRQKISLENTVE